MTEYEKKLLLSADEYLILLSSIGAFSSAEKLINYYYDTDSFEMNKQGVTCRIRQKGNEFKSTIKRHFENGCSEESSQKAEDEKDDSLFSEYGLKLQGSLVTVRTILYEDKNYTIVIDKNSYLNFVDYELEIEYLPQNHTDVNKVIKKLGEIIYYTKKDFNIDEFISRTSLIRTKSQRFFERKSDAGLNLLKKEILHANKTKEEISNESKK